VKDLVSQFMFRFGCQTDSIMLFRSRGGLAPPDHSGWKLNFRSFFF